MKKLLIGLGVLCIGMSVGAATVTTVISANLRKNVPMYINGLPVLGGKYEVITYKGKVYVPAKEIGGAVDATVEYKNGTLYVNQSLRDRLYETLNRVEKYDPYQELAERESIQRALNSDDVVIVEQEQPKEKSIEEIVAEIEKSIREETPEVTKSVYGFSN